MRNIYPKGPLPELDLARIEVWHHDSLLFAVHNMPCAVCSTAKAVLRTDVGRFQPCWECRQSGWVTVKAGWLALWFMRILGILR